MSLISNFFQNVQMKKILVLIAAFYLITFNKSEAQVYEKQDYPKLFAATDSLLNAYLELSYFRSSDDGTGIDPEVIEEFTSLFKEDATIDDELAPKFLNQPQEYDYNKYLFIETRSLSDYLRARVSYFSGGMTSIKIKSSSLSLSNISFGEVTIVIRKVTRAIYKSGSNEVIVVSDVNQAINAQYDKEKGRMIINKIIILNPTEAGTIPNYTHSNDMDMDFVPDRMDGDRRTAGLKSGDGMPDDAELRAMGMKRSKISAELSGFYAFNSISDLSFSDGLAYDNSTDHTNVGVKSALTYNNIGAQLLVTYNLDRKARFGVALGLRYNLINGEVSSEAINATYRGSDIQSGNLGFMRKIKSNGRLTESITASNIAIPILIKYKKTFHILADRLSFEAGIGPVFSLGWSGSSSFEENRFDYEGRYFFSNPTSITGVPELSEYDPSNSFYMELSGSVLESAGYTEAQSITFLDSYFERGFDVGKDVRADKNNVNSVSDFELSPSLGFMIQPAFLFKVSTKSYVSLSGSFLLTKFNNSAITDNYVVTNERGSYNTLMNGINSFTETQYGVQIGFRQDF